MSERARRDDPSTIDPDVAGPEPDGAPDRRGRVLVAIAFGGALGTSARDALSHAISVAPGSFPWSTFTINATGCFLLGAIVTVLVERWPTNRYARPFLAIGALGAYTTFSTYTVETTLLAKDGSASTAAAYVVTSVVVGVAAVCAGIAVAHLRPTSRGSGA